MSQGWQPSQRVPDAAVKEVDASFARYRLPLAKVERLATGITRWAEGPEDQALVDAGWKLYGSYQAGWGVRVIKALSGHDGMCRPLGFQEFVFADGRFAGTISPVVMDSRTDGSGRVIGLDQDGLTARFSRYSPEDPLCCPSGESMVQYDLERGDAGPVLVRQAT